MEIEQHLKHLEQRIARIEKKLGTYDFEDESAHLINQAKDELELTSQEQNQSAGNWLGVIGIVCLVFAAGFIIKLSMDSGWLTPLRQVVIASLFGLTLVATGIKLRSINLIYASYLPAAGIITLYCSIFAAERYYNLIQTEYALMLVALVSLLCVFLYKLFRHDIYAFTASIGSYIAPVILSLNFISSFTIFYFIACSATFSFVSIFVTSRVMAVTAGYFALAATSFVGFDLNQNGLIAFALVGQFLIFSAGTYGYSIYTRKELTLYEAWSIFPVLLLFYSAEYYFVEQILPGSAPWISLFFAFIILCLYLLTKTWLLKASLNSEPMIYAYIAIVVFHSVYLELMPNFLKPWLFVAIIFADALYLRLLGLPKGYTKHVIPILIIIGILVIEYYWIISTVFYNWTLAKPGDLSRH